MTLITIILIICAVLLMLLGLAGTIHPAIPGLPILYGGFFLLAYAQDYHYIGVTLLLIALLITIVGMVMDFIAGLLGAKMTGASKRAIWGAVIGGVVGIFLGPIGIIFGPLVGAAIGEYIEVKDALKAGKVGIGTFIGFIIGTVAKIGCALVILLMIPFAYLF